jgi:hypothetical protein
VQCYHDARKQQVWVSSNNGNTNRKIEEFLSGGGLAQALSGRDGSVRAGRTNRHIHKLGRKLAMPDGSDTGLVAGTMRPCTVCAKDLGLPPSVPRGPAWLSRAAQAFFDVHEVVEENLARSVGTYVSQRRDGHLNVNDNTDSDSDSDADVGSAPLSGPRTNAARPGARRLNEIYKWRSELGSARRPSPPESPGLPRRLRWRAPSVIRPVEAQDLSILRNQAAEAALLLGELGLQTTGFPERTRHRRYRPFSRDLMAGGACRASIPPVHPRTGSSICTMTMAISFPCGPHGRRGRRRGPMPEYSTKY